MTQVFSFPMAPVGRADCRQRGQELGHPRGGNALVQTSDDGGWAGAGAKEVERNGCAVDLTLPAIFTCPQWWTCSFYSDTSKCEEIFIEHLLYAGKGPRLWNIKMNNAPTSIRSQSHPTVLVTSPGTCGNRDVFRMLQGIEEGQ